MEDESKAFEQELGDEFKEAPGENAAHIYFSL